MPSLSICTSVVVVFEFVGVVVRVVVAFSAVLVTGVASDGVAGACCVVVVYVIVCIVGYGDVGVCVGVGYVVVFGVLLLMVLVVSLLLLRMLLFILLVLFAVLMLSFALVLLLSLFFRSMYA